MVILYIILPSGSASLASLRLNAIGLSLWFQEKRISISKRENIIPQINRIIQDPHMEVS